MKSKKQLGKLDAIMFEIIPKPSNPQRMKRAIEVLSNALDINGQLIFANLQAVTDRMAHAEYWTLQQEENFRKLLTYANDQARKRSQKNNGQARAKGAKRKDGKFLKKSLVRLPKAKKNQPNSENCKK